MRSTILVLALGACTDGGGTALPADEVVPDFALRDLNPNSTTHDTTVSPADQRGHVSAWYFGHAT